MASPSANLRDHPDLQSLVLHKVMLTGKTIGSGSYGSVEEVAIPGAFCAAKKIHDFLSQEDPNWLAKERADENIQKFVAECKMMGRLRHPNVVQFLGIWFSPKESTLPALYLVMEKMLTSLHDLLEPDTPKSSNAPKPYIPLSLKCSILCDIAQGIAYLHNQSPPVVHRDLSARNVLLNSAMVAKIADMGMARILPERNNATMTKAPGAFIYMPPEALEDKSKYDTSIDLFSLGVVAIFVLAQEFPDELKAPTYTDEWKGSLVARTELERREKYTEKIYSAFPKTHALIRLMESCLKNSPKARPTIDQALELLDQAVAGIQDFSHLQLNKLQLLQMVGKSTEILQQQEKRFQLELESVQQKCDAWREEVEKLSPLRDEVAQLHQENTRLQQELTHVTEDNAELGRQLQEMTSVKEKAPPDGTHLEEVEEMQSHLDSLGGVVSSSRVHNPPPTEKAASSEAVSGGATPANKCLVQFMWQPLAQMSYSKVTLLSSFESGSVDLSIDPDGGHYFSEHISVPSGTYEGQLVVGDSFIHPVKEFTVDSGCGGIVVLEFDIGASGNEGIGTGAGANVKCLQLPSTNIAPPKVQHVRGPNTHTILKGGHKANRKHWSMKAHESLIRRDAEGIFCLNIEGGAENGLMPFIGEIRKERIHYQSGKLVPGEILLEVNNKRVVGMIKKDVIALIKRSADPLSLVTVKQNVTITKDLRQYLATRFTRNSVDSELQHQIRENIHMRVVPCTTRSPQEGERQGVDYNFISVESFRRMEKNREFLESGTLQGNFYGTPLPPANPLTPSGPSHVNRITQYENPVMEAKRKHASAQLANRQNPTVQDERGLPPMRAPPPSFQSAAAMEKQLEAEAAARWPEAGFGDQGYYPYPYSSDQPNAERDLEAELQGDTLIVSLLKTTSGFGFIIIGGDRAGELLQIKNIVRGSIADRDGRLHVGDVLVRINDISVLSYSYRKVVELFQSIPLDSDVQIEVRRGYPLPGGEELPPYAGAHQYNEAPPGPAQFQSPPPPPQPEKLVVSIVKGPLGFGFSLGIGPMGPVVKQIMDHPRCAQLREGDIVLEVNGEKVQAYMHTDLVTVLKRCPKGNQANFTLLRQPQEPSELTSLLLSPTSTV